MATRKAAVVDDLPVVEVPVDVTVDVTVEPTVENVEIGQEEPLVYCASFVTEDLIQVKANTAQSDSVLKSQICTLLDQAIQLSLVK